MLGSLQIYTFEDSATGASGSLSEPCESASKDASSHESVAPWETYAVEVRLLSPPIFINLAQ